MKRSVLFSNFSLLSRSGTETFLRDLTTGLVARGWECGIYTPRMGALAEEFRQVGIPVWDRLEEIAMEPAILHCQHTLEALALRTRFPATRALFMVHDAHSWHDSVPRIGRWSALVAVDEYCRERVMRETGLSLAEIQLIHNGVDTATFRPRSPLPATPQRAAIFTSYAGKDDHVRMARAVCSRLGIALDELGPAAGRPVPDPQNWLPNYDLVFAKGRCAIEAMAVGCAVILIGPDGVGELVTTQNFPAFRERNFGRSLLRPGHDEAFLTAQVQRYAASEAKLVQEMVRSQCSADVMVEAFIRLYEALPPNPQPINGAPSQLSASEVAAWICPLLKEHAELNQRAQANLELLKQSQAKTQHYKAKAERYQTEVKRYKAKLAERSPERMSFWQRLRQRFRSVQPASDPSPMPFIVGAPRSGTTLLRLMLDAHAQLAIPPETGFLGHLEEAMGTNFTAERLVDWMATYPAGHAPLWPDFRISSQELLAAISKLPWMNPAQGVRCFYRLYAARFSKARWGDKTPDYALRMEAIRSLLPESRFIHLIRDGRDVALSLRAQPFSPGPSMRVQAQTWMKFVEAARRSADGLEGCLEVRYEDLVSNPESVLRMICEHIELPFDARMLHHEQHAEARLQEHAAKVHPDGTTVRTKEARRALQKNSARPVDASLAGGWREQLTTEEVREFESVAGRLLQELGYDLSGY